MKNSIFILLMTLTLYPLSSFAHCEIPCGIFGDEGRFLELMEHAETIEKSMNEINRLDGESDVDYHTIARWTFNKEDHAEKIQYMASRYFLAQRVKLPAADATADQIKDYEKHTTLLHKMIVKAMRTKQTTDTAAVTELRNVISDYKHHYFKDHEHEL
ncbi:MAG: superoxide dismutase [Ni] [Pseudomonadota bacterium]